MSKEFAQGAKEETFLDFDRVQTKSKISVGNISLLLSRDIAVRARVEDVLTLYHLVTQSRKKCPLLTVPLAIADDVLNLDNMSVSARLPVPVPVPLFQNVPDWDSI